MLDASDVEDDYYIMKAPPHPADFLNEVLMPATGRSDGEIARLLGISLPVFYTILTREKPITRATAEMLGRLFHTGVNFWLQMQAEYDRHSAPQIVVDSGSLASEPPARLSMRDADRTMPRLPKPLPSGRCPASDGPFIDFAAETLTAWEVPVPTGDRRGVE
jgi:addiction module HigA family antidote